MASLKASSTNRKENEFNFLSPRQLIPRIAFKSNMFNNHTFWNWRMGSYVMPASRHLPSKSRHITHLQQQSSLGLIFLAHRECQGMELEFQCMTEGFQCMEAEFQCMQVELRGMEYSRSVSRHTPGGAAANGSRCLTLLTLNLLHNSERRLPLEKIVLHLQLQGPIQLFLSF